MFVRINLSSFPKTWNFLLAKVSYEKKFLMILYFVEFLAYIEIVKYDLPQTSQFFKKKKMTLIEKKKRFFNRQYCSDREKTLNTL